MLLVLFFGLLVNAQEAQLESQEEVFAAPETTETSSASGETRLKTKKIKHPGAKEGLYLIDEEGVYHYRVQTVSKKDQAFFFRFMSQSAPNIEGVTDTTTFSFKDMYGVDELTGVDFVYEWQPFKNFGKLGLQFGAGFATASGKGKFANDDAREPRENYTFYSIPVSLGGVYRFEYTERQWFAPYVVAGGIYNGLVEHRDDGKIKAVGTASVFGSGGMLLNLTAIDKELAFKMDREYGFSQLWITAEYRRIQSFDKDLDITSNQISVGLGADY